MSLFAVCRWLRLKNNTTAAIAKNLSRQAVQMRVSQARFIAEAAVLRAEHIRRGADAQSKHFRAAVDGCTHRSALA
jgi:hypothetical protein